MIVRPDTRVAGRPLRVVHVASMMGSGGLEKWLVDLVARLEESGVEGVIVVRLDDLGVHGLRARELGLQVVSLHGTTLGFLRDFHRFLRDKGPFDVVHAHLHYYSGALLAIARAAGVRVRVAHAHNDTSSEPRSPGRRVYVALMRWLLRRFATRGYGVSEASRIDLFGNAEPEDSRWGVLPCGISQPEVPGSSTEANLRQELGILPGQKVIVQVGRLVGMKNQMWSIRLLAGLDRSDVVLLLLGDGPDQRQLAKLAADLGVAGRVVFAGARPDVMAINELLADVFLFPSLPGEGAPIALIEAQSVGLPCVISGGVQRASVIVPEIVTQLDLGEGLVRWTQVVAGLLERRPAFTPAEAARRLADSPFSLEDNVRRLVGDYSLREGSAR